MGLVLKFVVITKAGTYHYRRRVPGEVASVIHKREFKKLLGKSEREALLAWPGFHGEVEREIAQAKRKIAGGSATDGMTELEAYREARRRVSEMVALGYSEDDLYTAGDSLADSFAQDDETGSPLGASSVERHTINLLRNGPEQVAKLKPSFTISDAKRLYVAEHLGADADTRVLARVDRVIGLAQAVLGNPAVVDISREGARRVRDHMLSRLKSNGRPIARTSVEREMNDLRAIINFAQVEKELPDTFRSPFNGLPLGTANQLETDDEAREPLPEKILAAVRRRILGRAGPEVQLIWRLLEGTGCRLAEIAGLRVQDIVLDGALGSDYPHIKVSWHEDRRVKTKASVRHVPLVGDALHAAEQALLLPRDGHMAFRRYGNTKGPTNLSQILMKHVRRETENPKHVVHSLRHNMKDNLTLAEVSSLNSNLIMGWTLGGVGDRVYGGSKTKLRVTTRAMKRAMGVPLDENDQGSSGDVEDQA